MDKNKNRWLVIGLTLAVGLLLMSQLYFTGQEQTVTVQEGKEQDTAAEPISVSSEIIRLERVTEQRLEQILSEIEGAGKVSVTLFLVAGPEYNYASNVNSSKRTIEEQDQAGGTRITTEVDEETQLVMSRAASAAGDRPVVVKEIKPDVQGVLVVAEGASSPYIKETLSRAVQTLLGIPAHQVTVLPRR